MPPEASLAHAGGRSLPVRGGRRKRCDFDVGDALVLAHHGVGTVVERRVRDLGGGRREYLTVELQRRSMTVRIPTAALDGTRLRPVASPAELRRCLNTLGATPQAAAGNWANRRKEALSKIGSGDPRRLAEVVRDLAHLGSAKPLAANDRGLYATARELLESELAVALELDRPAAAAEIDRRLPCRPLGS
jgi:CarD family transcriptional regulator